VQLPPETTDARLQTVEGILRQTRGIAAVRLLDAKETAQLLEPWLGPAPPVGELPVPRLIDLKISPDAPPDLSALRQQLTSVVPEVRLIDHRSLLGDMHAERRSAQVVFASVIVLATLLIMITTIYASETALIVEHEVLKLVHLLGADDADIARQITVRACMIAVLGSALGVLAAIASEAALRGSLGSLELTLPLADWRLWAVFAVAIVISGLLAALSAQIAVRRRLAALP